MIKMDIKMIMDLNDRAYYESMLQLYNKLRSLYCQLMEGITVIIVDDFNFYSIRFK